MRLIVPLIALTVFALFAALYTWQPELYGALLEAWAVPIGEIPFIDFHAVLAAIQCHRLGEDVLVHNSCDMIGRPHVYSPLWLMLPIPANVNQTMVWGLALNTGFLVALISLPLPRTGRTVMVMLAAVLSPSVFLAVERANNDMVVLLLAVLAGHLLTRAPTLRLIAYALLCFAALLKYYPALALVLAVRESPRRFAAIAGLSFAAALALAVAFADRWAEMAKLLVWVLRFGLYTFSLRNPIEYAAHDYPQLREQPTQALLLAALLIAFVGIVWGWRRRLRREGILVRPDQSIDMLLAVSGLMVAACFVSGSSLPYRAVLLLPTLPALLSWATALPNPAGRRSAGIMAGLLVFLLWLPLLHHAAAPLISGGGVVGLLAHLWQALLISIKEVGWWIVASFLAAVSIPPLNAIRPRKG